MVAHSYEYAKKYWCALENDEFYEYILILKIMKLSVRYRINSFSVVAIIWPTRVF